MSACGLWRIRRRLLAVVLDEHGRARPPISVAPTDDARWSLLVWLQARGHRALVLTDELARGDPIAGMALTLGGLQVWVAPAAMVEGVRQVTAVASRPPRHTAALLARWPSVPSLRQHLRIAVPDTDGRQLALW